MDMDQSASSTSNPLPSKPHVLWRQLLGFILWVGVLSFAAGGPVSAALCLILGGLTFADAWQSGIYKRSDKASFLNISPMAWGIVMALLFIVAYPAYVLNRSKLRTIQGPNGYFLALTIVGAIVVVLFAINVIAIYNHRSP
jgi:hypothetical protein